MEAANVNGDRTHLMAAGQRTIAKSSQAHFWDRVAVRYARSPVSDEAAYRRKLALTRDYLRPDMELLEIGCGTGTTAIAHAPFVRHIRATDISQEMLTIARGKAEAANVSNITFEHAAFERLDVADNSVDAVLALSILHLLDDRDAAIARVRGKLKPGGVFVSSTACLGNSQRWFRFVAPVGKALGLFPTVRIFTRGELEDSVTRAGFYIRHSWQPGKGKAVFLIAQKV